MTFEELTAWWEGCGGHVLSRTPLRINRPPVDFELWAFITPNWTTIVAEWDNYPGVVDPLAWYGSGRGFEECTLEAFQARLLVYRETHEQEWKNDGS